MFHQSTARGVYRLCLILLYFVKKKYYLESMIGKNIMKQYFKTREFLEVINVFIKKKTNLKRGSDRYSSLD